MNTGERKFCENQKNMSGSFYSALFSAMRLADKHNLEKIAQGFPEEAEALRNYRKVPGYWDQLMREWNDEVNNEALKFQEIIGRDLNEQKNTEV